MPAFFIAALTGYVDKRDWKCSLCKQKCEKTGLTLQVMPWNFTHFPGFPVKKLDICIRNETGSLTDVYKMLDETEFANMLDQNILDY